MLRGGASHGRYQSFVTPAPASTWGKTPKILPEGAASPHPHLAVVMRLQHFKPSQLTVGSCVETCSVWWDGAGGFGLPRFRGPRAKGQRLLLCPAFTLKSWRWGRAAARLETNANTESYLCGRTWFFKKKTPGRRHRSASDPKHQWELTRQVPWAQCTLTPVSFKPLARRPYLIPPSLAATPV